MGGPDASLDEQDAHRTMYSTDCPGMWNRKPKSLSPTAAPSNCILAKSSPPSPPFPENKLVKKVSRRSII